MSSIDHEVLNELCEKIDLLEYAEQTMEFRRRGDKYFASCPKHSDSDPSLCISSDKNLYYCFSCHRGGNILNWMMDYENLSFQQAVDKVCKITGEDIKHVTICESLKYFKELKKLAEEQITQPIERQILPETYLDRFAQEIPQEWVDEGISADAMKMYGVCIDKVSNRICYPMYDDDDNLISVKGRTRFKNFKDLKIQKYQSYQKIKTTNLFVGMKQNRQAIKQAGSVIIFEGIKSGLKLCSWGLGSCWLAAETSRLNKAQIEILLKLHISEIIIAFDRDVNLQDIKENTELLRRFTNVYVVRDRYNKNRLLPGDKDSPVDAGKDVWLQLLSEKRRL